MKQWIKRILLGGAALLAAIGCVMICSEKTATTPQLPEDTTMQPPQHTTLHLPPIVCQYMLGGVTPEEFCETKGAGTVLHGCYKHAEVDSDGCLILVVENYIVKGWKDSLMSMQIMQCVFGEDRDIGVTVDYSLDFLGFMENADTCGFEISEDYTKIIDEYGDNTFYSGYIMRACLAMQVFEGKTCENITVEYIRYEANGEVGERIIYPDFVKPQ